MPHKRKRGDGSIYKRRNVSAWPWVAVAPAEYTLGADGKAKTTRPVLGHYRTAREATAALDAAYLRLPTTKYNITLTALYEEWSAPSVGPASWEPPNRCPKQRKITLNCYVST